MTFRGGAVLYLFCLLLLLWFWWRVRGLSFTELLDRAAREHHLVLSVSARYPRGGTWKQYQRWLEEAIHNH